MAPATDDELRLLREQAFGRGADGATRAAALARLAELDGAARTAKVDTAGDEGVAAASPSLAADGAARPGAAADTQSAASESDPVLSAPADGVSGRRWIERLAVRMRGLPSTRLLALWAASLVLAVAVTLGGMAAVSSIDVHRVAVLHVDPDGELPPELDMPGDVTVFEEFHGLSVAVHPGATFGYDPDGRCVQGMAPLSEDQPGAYYGFGACEAGSFPVVATMMVEESSPESVRDIFPVGTALQFELSGDQIIVRAD
ncbi:hypothetical protein [Microbacterium sp. JZ101]